MIRAVTNSIAYLPVTRARAYTSSSAELNFFLNRFVSLL